MSRRNQRNHKHWCELACARLLAAFLEAEGYDVWWDTSLLSGDKFRKVIMEELAKARAAIVIWTENSVSSDWVMSEAGRAHADQKLIPVKARGLEYKDIPPPFENQHTENLDAHENILAAVQGQLAKAPPPAPIWKKARFELFTWFGIVGAAVTLAANLRGVVQLAVWARSLVDNWVAAITWVWKTALFFLPDVTGLDAIFLTFVSLITMNFISSTVTQRKKRSINFKYYPPYALPMIIIMSVFAFEYVNHMMKTHPLITLKIQTIEKPYDKNLFHNPTDYFNSISIQAHDYLDNAILDLSKKYILDDDYRHGLAFVSATIIIFVIPIACVSWIVRAALRLSNRHISSRALSTRLWRILICFILILVLNYASLWIEQQQWASTLLSG